MAEDIFRPDPQRRRPTPEQMGEDHSPPQRPWQPAMDAADLAAMGTEDGEMRPRGDGGGLEIKGNVPPQFAAMLKGKTPQPSRAPTAMHPSGAEIGPLQDLLQRLVGKTHNYESIQMPSRGRFYDGVDGPTDGVLQVRPMTGEEEQILSTPRYVKKGKAIDMIFASCVQGQFQPERLLTADRTHLLIYLRGISYTPNYDVEITCPECQNHYQTTISLELPVEMCPDDFGPESLKGVLPVSGFHFTYRLARGSDDSSVSQYREHRAKGWGDAVADDTLAFRLATLVEEVEGISDKAQIQALAKKLPISDLSHIRNLVNDPPFGVDTDIEMLCPSCFREFTVEMPLESTFFFPRRKRSRGPA